jgi:hypothetical protein
MTKHSPENSSNLPFHEVTINEFDLLQLGDTGAYLVMRREATSLGYEREQLLYRGMDREDIVAQGGFRHERDLESGSHPEAVWAFTDDEFDDSAREADRIGSRGTNSVLQYAFQNEHPAVVIMDREKMQSLAEHIGATATAADELQYIPREGHTLEDAIIAVFTITD